MKRNSLCGLILVSLSLPGLAANNQGISDYAKAHWNVDNSCVPFVRKYESVCGANFASDLGRKEDQYDNRAQPNSCSGLAPDQRSQVKKGDTIALYLQQAYISEFTERFESFFRGKDTKGEIAIVARIAELDASNDFDFSDKGVDRGRLIYYSEGVHAKQFLNFSQLPIYGPIEYAGKPLAITFHIIELDVKENSEISGLLSAVAGLGATVYPPASPILKVLDKIGGGLLKANKNDTEFRYHATLLPDAGQVRSIKDGVLEYGNYAFVRMPFETNSEHPWRGLWFNQKTGRIYSEGTCNIPTLNLTYFTVQINRAEIATTLDASNTFAAFVTKLDAEATASLAKKVVLIDELKNSVNEQKAYRDAKALINHAASQRWPKGTPVAGGPIDPPTLKALGALLADIQASITGPKSSPPAAGRFTEDRVSNLVSALSELAGTVKFSPLSFEAAEVQKVLATTPARAGP